MQRAILDTPARDELVDRPFDAAEILAGLESEDEEVS